MQDAKEEVRARLNIEDVIGDYVQLKRAGRNFRGLSPFNSEKTPSFYVSPEKQIWHDFSSNRGGDVFSFVMEAEGVGFRDSLEILARKAGVDLSVYENEGDKKLSYLKKRLILAHSLATDYYQQSLLKNEHALEYVFKKRQLNKAVVKDFKIGYAPSAGDALVNFLIKKGFNKTELSQAGLVNRFGGDLFRGRIIIPLMDHSGQTIGFTGRAIHDDPKSPKYLNTSQTVIYDKSRHVFGLSQAKESIRSNDYAVVVEGNLDVVSSHQVDIKQVVATAGTALTEYHLRALARLTSNIRLAFDGDKAGLSATERAIPIAQSVGLDLFIISMPDQAKDPDELIKKDPGLWTEAINQAQPAVDWVISQYNKRYDLKTASGKSSFTTASLRLIKLIEDPVVQEHYLEIVANYCQSSIEVLKQKLSDDSQDIKTYRQVNSHEEPKIDESAYQDSLLSIAFIDRAVRDLFNQDNIKLLDGEVRQLVAECVASQTKVIKKVPDELQKYDVYVKILLLKAETRYADWGQQDRYFEAARLLKKLVKENTKKQKYLLTAKLRDLELVGDESGAEEIRQKLNKIIKETKSG